MLEYLSFMGRVLGTAVRHGMQLGVALPRHVWKALAGLRVAPADLADVDRAGYEEAKSSLEEAELVRGGVGVSCAYAPAVRPVVC
jgi:hypothetical protein